MFSFVCSGCGDKKFFLRKKGMAVGLYCYACSKWHKWVGKNDVQKLKSMGYRVFEENYLPNISVHNNVSDNLNHDVPVFDVVKEEKESLLNEGCHVCISGVLDPLGDFDTSAVIFENVLVIRTKDNSVLHGSYKINFCPNCGKKLV